MMTNQSYSRGAMEEETSEPEEEKFEEEQPIRTLLFGGLLLFICFATIWTALPIVVALSSLPTCYVKCWVAPYGEDCRDCKSDGTIKMTTHKAATARGVHEVSIAEMAEGEEGYMLPWGLAVDEKHRFWVNSKYTVGDKGGNRSVLIKKGKDCITVLDDAGTNFVIRSSETPNWYDMKWCE